MIIDCINCNKKFNVESELIPSDGRLIQCGSCNYAWHYKIEVVSSKPLILDIAEKAKEIKEVVNIETEDSKNLVKKKTSTLLKKNIEFKESNKEIEN